MHNAHKDMRLEGHITNYCGKGQKKLSSHQLLDMLDVLVLDSFAAQIQSVLASIIIDEYPGV